MKKGLETITKKKYLKESNSSYVNNKNSKNKITIDTDENKNNFRKILNKSKFKNNNKNSNKKRDNYLVSNNISNDVIQNQYKQKDKFSIMNLDDLSRKNQSNLENKFKPESIPNNSYNEVMGKTERSFLCLNLLKKDNLLNKNFHTLNNNSKTNINSNYDDYNKTHENINNNIQRLNRTDIFNYEIKNPSMNQFPKVIDYSSGKSRSKSIDRNYSIINDDQQEFNDKVKSENEFGPNKDNCNGLTINNYNFCEEIIKCKKPKDINKNINNHSYLNNFLNSSEENELYDNYKNTNENNNSNNHHQVNFTNSKFRNDIDQKYDEINCLIAGKNYTNKKNPIKIKKENKTENKKSNIGVVRTKRENKNKKEIFIFKNFKSKCLQRSKSFSKSIPKSKSCSISADNKQNKPSNQFNNIKNTEINNNINNISINSDAGKRSFSQCNKKIKEIASQRGIPKKTPIIIKNLKINFIKFVKPTYTVVYCGKERICKYRNRLTDPFNININLKDEVEIFGNILKNSELYSNRKKISKLKQIKVSDSVEKKKINFEMLSNSKSIKFSKKIFNDNLKNMDYLNNNDERDFNSEEDLSKGRNRYRTMVSSNKINKGAEKELSEKKQSKFTIEEIIPWLEDLEIIKYSTISLDDLSAISSNGILLADLINRLEGVFN